MDSGLKLEPGEEATYVPPGKEVDVDTSQDSPFLNNTHNWQ